MTAQCKRPSKLPRTGAYYYWTPAPSRARNHRVSFYFQVVKDRGKRDVVFLLARMHSTETLARVPTGLDVSSPTESVRLTQWLNFGSWSKRIGMEPVPVTYDQVVVQGLRSTSLYSIEEKA